MRAVYLIAAGWAAAVICILLQERQIDRLSQTNHDLQASVARVTAAHTGLSLALADLTAARARDNQLIADHADARDRAQAAAAGLEQQLREALRHAQTLDLDAPLPAAAARALCLRWHAASGRYAADHPHDPAGPVAAGAADTHARLCDGWRQVTLRDALEWAGLLLDHAGSERLDKAALREWAAQGDETMGKSK